MAATPQPVLAETSGVTPWSRRLYKDADEFWKDSEGLHHAYLIYRTLRGDYADLFTPDAVFYVGRSPAAYLKKVRTNEISEEDERQWQRFLWNQAVVPMLIVKSRMRIRVYTAYTQPKEQGSQEKIALVLDEAAVALELDQLWTAIEAGTIYEFKPELFKKSHSVDKFLLDNLNATAHQLAATQEGGVNEENLKFAHLFLIRLLFVCYLIEREMIKGEHFEDEALKKLRAAKNGAGGFFLRHLLDDLKTPAQKKRVLCNLFIWVKEHFNGSLFTKKITEEKERYNPQFLNVLNEFLQGHEVKTGQKTLGFWAYDFSVIPIEMISAVYEGFLGSQGEIEEAQTGTDSKRTTGAYYTPLHLAELVVDMALENVEKPIHELKCLDPACGSGVFLVSLVGRMVESIRRKENYTGESRRIGWARKLLPLLQQLYGIDINPTACQITCFSLYLAVLEQLKPMDIEYLYEKNEKLPYLLVGSNNTGSDNTVYDTVHKGNIFDPNLSIAEREFDIVIGNPPWVSRENQKDDDFLEWCKSNPKVLGPEKQIAHGFMWKAPEYFSSSGVGCLLLPTAVILNKDTNQFQSEWMKSFSVENVINFADLSFILFENADRPCVAIRFSGTKPTDDLRIQYKIPKTDIHSKRGGSIYIREEDVTILLLKDIINAAKDGKAPIVWKSRLWGTWRDNRLIMRLSDLPKLCDLTGQIRKKGKRWIKGQGCQPYSKTDAKRNRKIYEPWWDDSLQFLQPGENINLVVTEGDFVDIPSEFKRLRMSPNRDLFEKSKVITSQGSRDMKIAFCKKPVLFRHSIQSIAGPPADADYLRFLSIVIKSDVIQYYLFHTSANWGTERDKVLFYELLSLPFFLPEDADDPKKAKDLIDEAVREIKGFEKSLEAGKWFGEEERRK
nr:N-6 DNA methylase [Bacteroidota bacterium]